MDEVDSTYHKNGYQQNSMSTATYNVYRMLVSVDWTLPTSFRSACILSIRKQRPYCSSVHVQMRREHHTGILY